MRRSVFVTLIAGSLAACGAPEVRRTTSAELGQLLSLGRRVKHAALMQEAPGLSLADGAEARIFRVERGHDESVPSLIQFDTTTSPALAEDEVAAYAAGWLADNAVDLGLAEGELTPSERFGTWLSEKVYTLSFDRSYAGLPVRDAFVQVNFAVDAEGAFRLREVVNRSHGVIRLENPDAAPVTIEEVAEALQDVGLTPLSTRQLIYPVEGEVLDVTMLRATEVRAFDESEGVEATLTFANGSYEPLEAYRHRYAARVSVQAMVVGRTYLDPARVPVAVPFTTAAGAPAPTDGDGAYEATLAAGDQVSFRLTSARTVTVADGANAAYTVTGSFDAAQQRITLQPEGDALVGLNAYLSIHRINGFTRRHLRQTEAGMLGRAIQVNTNVAGSCNAFYDGTGISLFAAGDGCANMALINDVAYHEWGHGLDDTVGRTAGITDGAFSEGIGDILSAYYTNSSVMAPGFMQGSTTGIRELNNTLKFPDNVGEVHQEGQTIGGAFWDLRKGLVERHGATRGAFLADRFFMRHLLVTDSYRESYQSVMTLDDDDANPMTPSPNKCLITAAFAKHGLATEEPNCQDVPSAALAVKTEPTLALSVLTPAANGATLMAAGPQATRSIFACVGAEAECVAAKRQDVTFKLDGSKGAKVLFVSDQPFALAEQQFMTLFAVDGQGAVLGKRTFLVHAK
jgi:hypothetical protein